MKSLVRTVIWWPGMDSEIESCVQSCHTCQSSCHQPMKAQLRPWIFTDKSWSLLRIDYYGQISGKMLLGIIDSHSKWLELHNI